MGAGHSPGSATVSAPYTVTPHIHKPWRAGPERIQCQVRALEVLYDYKDPAQFYTAEKKRRLAFSKYKKIRKVLADDCELHWTTESWRKKLGTKLPPIARMVITRPDNRGIQRQKHSLMSCVPGRLWTPREVSSTSLWQLAQLQQYQNIPAGYPYYSSPNIYGGYNVSVSSNGGRWLQDSHGNASFHNFGCQCGCGT